MEVDLGVKGVLDGEDVNAGGWLVFELELAGLDRGGAMVDCDGCSLMRLKRGLIVLVDAKVES